MRTKIEIDLDCFKRINSLATGRFLRNEALNWIFKSKHLQLMVLSSLLMMGYIFLTEGIYVGLPLILMLGVLTAVNLATLSVRHASGDCYVEGYRQGFIDAVITDHFDANLLGDDDQKIYIETRLKHLYSQIEKADPKYLELQRDYMYVGRMKAVTFLTRNYREEI